MKSVFTTTLGRHVVRTVEDWAERTGQKVECRIIDSENAIQYAVTVPDSHFREMGRSDGWRFPSMPPRPVRRRFMVGQSRMVSSRVELRDDE